MDMAESPQLVLNCRRVLYKDCGNGREKLTATHTRYDYYNWVVRWYTFD